MKHKNNKSFGLKSSILKKCCLFLNFNHVIYNLLNMNIKQVNLFLIFFIFLYSCRPMKEKVDLLVINGRIYTVDSTDRIVESMAIKDGKSLRLGTTDEILGLFRASDTLDANGKSIFPGFIDAHCHFVGLAKNLQYVDLIGANSFDEVIDRVKSFKPVLPGRWIVGRGWDQNLWKNKQFPDKKILDQIFADKPVILIRIDGHIVLSNEAAIKKAGIGTNHKFKSNEVETKNGKLTGILRENAADYIRSIVPAPEDNCMTGLLSIAERLCYSSGLTGVSDAGLDYGIIRLLDTLQKQNKLKISIYAMLDPTQKNISFFVNKGPLETKSLTIRSIKIYADGSLGSRTALLKKSYSDAPGNTGILVTNVDSIKTLCKLAMEHNYQINTHAIGDSAIKLVLEIYSSFVKEKNDKRWRIEHSQVVDLKDIHLFGDYSIIPSVQTTHATSDMKWAKDRIGEERIKGAYAYQTLLKQNGWLPNGTDFPIENMSPILNFYAAVARQDLTGKPEAGFEKENALTREEALKSITIWAAKANFWESVRGSLEKGKSADFVVLDKNIMEINESEIPPTRVLKTFVSGECVFNLSSDGK